MRLLLDTHAALWWWGFPEKLSSSVKAALTNPESEIFFSAVSGYEISWKHQLGKLVIPSSLRDHLAAAIHEEGWKILNLTLPHTVAAGRHESEHRDPFDRLLAAQAISEDLSLISADAALDTFPELVRLW